MKRRVIEINEEKCDGCGICAEACHEGAIGMVEGKAKLLSDSYCDGLGDCLPACPTGAISFIEREAAAYDEEAVARNMAMREQQEKPFQCPGSMAKTMKPKLSVVKEEKSVEPISSQLLQWPVQIKLAPVQAPYFDNANLLIAADCTAYAYGDFHKKFMKNKVTLVGCPKLDEGDYSEKLGEIIANNNLKSVTLVRMEVPCCGGLEQALKQALINSGKMIPWQVVTITTEGEILED